MRMLSARNGFIGKNEFAKITIENSIGRTDRRIAVPGWRWVGVSVKRRLPQACARPKAGACDFMRIRFPRDIVRKVGNSARVCGRAPTGKTRDSEIETPPKEMRWTAFADPAGTEKIEDLVDMHQSVVKATHGSVVVRGARLVGRKGSCIT